MFGLIIFALALAQKLRQGAVRAKCLACGAGNCNACSGAHCDCTHPGGLDDD